MDIKRSIFLPIFLLLLYAEGAVALPAFPGAEGFGSDTIGGRGGTVIKVTNLNDSGPASFREAVEAAPRNFANGTYQQESDQEYVQRLDSSGHRIVVFDVSGTIVLESPLDITYSYMTIAGETSPGGILVTGHKSMLKGHDIIMRHMRFRVGSHKAQFDRDSNGDIIYYDIPQYSFPPTGSTGNGCQGNVTTAANGFPCAIAGGANTEVLDSFEILGPRWSGFVGGAHNIIIDHCSFSWGVDETFSVTGGVENTTVQWSIVSEGLSKAGHPEGEHSKGFMVSGKYEYDSSVSLHHNYFAHSKDRLPLIYSPFISQLGITVDTVVDVVNNISYNWLGGLAPISQETPKVNWVHNYSKPGINSFGYYEIRHEASNNTTPVPWIYVHGNMGVTRMSQSDPHWNIGWSWKNELCSTAWQKTTPWNAPSVTTTSMSHNYPLEILNSVGATKPLRDSVDVRVVADFAAGTGTIPDNVTYPDDFPVFSSIPAPTDSDNDGMPDTWELSNGYDINIDDSALDLNNNGYTNIEEYLHSLAGPIPTPSPTISATPTPLPTATATATPTVTPSPSPTARRGIISHYKFDETEGTTAADSSVNNNIGSVQGDATWVDGQINGALSFDGVDDYVDIGVQSYLDNIGPLTYAVWIKPDNLNGSKGIVIKDHPTNPWMSSKSFHLEATSFGFELRGNTNLRKATLWNTAISNQWQHVAVTWNGSENATGVHIYINGVEPGSYRMANNGISILDDSGTKTALGKRENDTFMYSGQMDDVRIYNYALSPEEISDLYAGILQSPDTDNDGLNDPWEITHFGDISSYNGSDDPDADGLDNVGEITANTDPNIADSDGDGITDGDEVASGTNPLNNAPQLAVIGDQTITEGETLVLNISATDAENDALAFSANNLPIGAVFTDNGDGTATFNWVTTAGDANSYGGVQIEVSDGKEIDFEDIEIIVASALDVGLAGYWKLDETFGTTADDSTVNNNIGSVQGGASWIEGQVNGALSFDGVDDYVDIGVRSSLDNIAPLTYAVWVNPNNLAGSKGIVIKDHPTNPWMSSKSFHMEATSFGFEVRGTTNLRKATLWNSAVSNQWQHVVVTWDGSENASGVHIYINGVEPESYRMSYDGISLLDDTGTKTVLGKRENGTFIFSGLMDDVRIYNRVLTSEEVSELYTGSLPSSDTDNDGLNDQWEITHFGNITSYNGSDDPDADGLDNAGEITAGTDPNRADSDGDGVTDGEEVSSGSNPLNNAPKLEAIGDQTIIEGETLMLNISATDAENDALVYSANNLPAGVLFIDNGDGTATLSWVTVFGDANSYSGVHIEVSDSKETDFEDISIVVESASDFGLVGYWKFDETFGTTADDSSVNNNIGAVQGGASWVNGQVNGALSLDGIDDYVDMGVKPHWII